MLIYCTLYALDYALVTKLINDIRVYGKPLQNSQILNDVAAKYAGVMAAKGEMGHSVDGTDFGDRIKQGGYSGKSLAENVAAGQKDEADVMASWDKSPGHHANIVNPNYTEYGIGSAKGADGTLYWAQNFGDGDTAAATPQEQPGQAPNANESTPREPQPSGKPAMEPKPMNNSTDNANEPATNDAPIAGNLQMPPIGDQNDIPKTPSPADQSDNPQSPPETPPKSTLKSNRKCILFKNGNSMINK